MKVWEVTKYGNPKDVLEIKEYEKPLIQANEILIKVEAASLNFFDILMCQGEYQVRPEVPFQIGSEIAGTIVETSANSKYEIGQKVVALPRIPNGGLVEYLAIDEGSVFPISTSIPNHHAAAMFVNFHTVYYALVKRAQIQPGETLLVHAGAGGIGSAAIQLGKALGAKVIATAGGPEKVKVCKEIGADVAIDYLQENFKDVVREVTNGAGANVILDTVGGDVFDQSRRCVASEGRILVVGFTSGTIPSVPANHVLVKNYSVIGVHWGSSADFIKEETEEHEAIMKLHEEGKITPLIYKVFSFDELVEALNLIEERKTYGKLVIEM